MALRSFIDELEDPSALKPILPQLMDSIFKLMSEVGTGCAPWLHVAFGSCPLRGCTHTGSLMLVVCTMCACSGDA